MPIDHVQIVSIPVTDQDRARDFYINALDRELISDDDESERRWVEVAPKHGQTSRPDGKLRDGEVVAQRSSRRRIRLEDAGSIPAGLAA